MSSITCPSCSRQLSADAAFCSACGTPTSLSTARPTPEGTWSPPKIRVPWSLGLLLVLGAASVWSDGGGPPRSELAAPPPALEPEIPEVDRFDAAHRAARAAASRQAAAESRQRAIEAAIESLTQSMEDQNAERRREAVEPEADVERQSGAPEAAATPGDNRVEEGPLAAPQPDGVLQLIALPFANVFVNGSLRAEGTSRLVLSLAPGTYALRLVNEARETVDTSFVIRPGQPTEVRAILPPRSERDR